MSNASKTAKDLDQWWDESWREREELLRRVFGETEPPGTVVAYSWERVDMIIPGACCLSFPPGGSERPHWLYLTLGLSQPLTPTKDDRGPSAYGWEFGFLAREASDWAPEALYEILSYWMETKNRIDVAHRVPMAFYREGHESRLAPYLRDLEPADQFHPFGEIRALVFWPYLHFPGQFQTSTGHFGILIGTAITADELALAQQSSSAHLLLLLSRAGIGQISDLQRRSVTAASNFQDQWQAIKGLSENEARAILSRSAS